jgi:nucleotide-binding universal stress UspA family protein
MILIAYDGSDDAKSAIEHAATLLPGYPAVVLTVWEPFLTIMTRSAAGLGPIAGMSDIRDIDDASRQAATERAEQGAEVAREAGIDASARAVSRSGSIAEAILQEAERSQAAAIVIGSRGLTGLSSLLLGSVSHAVMQHADRPVLVIPSSKVAARRSDALHAHEHAATAE